MTLTQILAFSFLALLTGWFVPRRWRLVVLLVGSLLSIYWLQPSTPIRNLDFWLPTVSITLTIFVWAVTQTRKSRSWRPTFFTILLILGCIILIGLTRYAGALCCLTSTRPPEILQILLALGLGFGLALVPHFLPKNRFIPALAIILILGLFVILKTGPLAQSSSAWLRFLMGQPVNLATTVDLPWLGFSFLAFRLLHALRDHQAGKLPAYSLGEFVTYGVFFPTYPGGPIDRSQRFIGELNHTISPSDNQQDHRHKAENLLQGSQRILIGAFKKFVLADSLALIALNGQNAAQTSSTLWAWVLLYAYALRIYLDFSGYTDVAIGLGRLMDFRLPENFDKPYIKPNLTTFWNSWHITLAQWFRAYFFNPFTRALRSTPRKLPAWLIILIGQFSTMVLIGLWHGVTWNFFMWGAWHGLGLFAHNRWTDWMRPRQNRLESHPFFNRSLRFGSWFLTFNYVSLGWVWFALPNLAVAETMFRKLAGI